MRMRGIVKIYVILLTKSLLNGIIGITLWWRSVPFLGRVIFVTAFKGGVGKTTAAAGIAAALASLGKRVCIVDADFGMRCMDLVLGMESSVLYDCSDVLSGRCTLSEAIVPVGGSGSLWFLPAPMRYDGRGLSKENADALFAELRRTYDYCLVDSSAELSDYYRLFAGEADEAIVVSLHQSTAVRAAEKTAANLASFGHWRIRLIVNGYRANLASAGRLPTLFEMIRRSSVPLLGAVPASETLPADQEKGETAFGGKEKRRLRSYEAAFLNIALRLCGVGVPLLEGVAPPGRKAARLAEARKRLPEERTVSI